MAPLGGLGGNLLNLSGRDREVVTDSAYKLSRKRFRYRSGEMQSDGQTATVVTN